MWKADDHLNDPFCHPYPAMPSPSHKMPTISLFSLLEGGGKYFNVPRGSTKEISLETLSCVNTQETHCVLYCLLIPPLR